MNTNRIDFGEYKYVGAVSVMDKTKRETDHILRESLIIGEKIIAAKQQELNNRKRLRNSYTK